MPKILHLCEFASLNGGERSMLAVLEGIRRAGFTSIVMAPESGPLADALAARGIELVPLPRFADDGQRLSQQHLRERLASFLARRRPDILHGNSLAMGRLSGPVAAELQVPSLSHLRDIVGLSRQAVADLNRHSRLLAVSLATAEFHAAQGVAADRLHVVYNGIDVEQFRPRPPTGFLHHELQLPPETPLVGVVGQIGLRKGQDVLLHAAARLAGEWPSVHYVVVGQRHSDKEESRQFERDLHAMADGALAGRVHFLGTRNDLGRMLNEWTVLAHPARQEPLGRVLLEAAASGLAIVATDVGGTCEIFPADAHAAMTVPADDAAAMADALDRVLADPVMRSRLGAAARQRVLEQFTVEKSAAQLLPHYDAMLA